MNKALQNLGLCKRANKLISGEEQVLERIKKNTTSLVLLASDAGNNTKKRVTDKASTYHVEIINIYTTDELNQAIGTKNRKVIAITDSNFVKLIKKQQDK